MGQAICYHILKALVLLTRRQTVVDIGVQSEMEQVCADLQFMRTIRSSGIGNIYTGEVTVIYSLIRVVFFTDKSVNQVFRLTHPFFLWLRLL